MFKVRLLISLNIAATMLIGSVALAHGEDKPGPHEGHVRMPANFHTEVLADADGAFRVYLLDMQFKNPVVKNSQITGYVKKGKKKISLKCEVSEDHFLCKSQKPQKTDNQVGTLMLKATRDGVQALTEAKYELPLKPFSDKLPQDATGEKDATAADKTTDDKTDHSKHH